MSLLNMKIGVLNIKIDIKKNKERQKNIMEKRYFHEKRIDEAIEIRNNIEQKYYLNNILQ